MFKLYYILTYPLTLIFLFFLLLYRKLLTKAKARCCHFLPTCSKYAWDSVREYGAVWGGVLTIKRLLKCNPKHKAGIDFPKLNILGNYKWKC